MIDMKKRISPRLTKDADYLLSRMDKSESGCWLWNGPISREGYGHIKSKNPITRKVTHGAHRIAYQVFIGEIPVGKVIDHLCRVRNCINPEHLEAVSGRENVMRSSITLAFKNASKTHCPQGHEYSAENTVVYSKPGYSMRSCKTCSRAHSLKYKAGA